jgi:hypothetical protein
MSDEVQQAESAATATEPSQEPEKPATKLRSINGGVGMPGALLLDAFGSYVWDAFGEIPYHVGSSLETEKGTTDWGGARLNKGQWRDVDVRLILDDERFKTEFGDPNDLHRNAKWVATCLAWSAFGRQLTGLPIDFQIQQMTKANKEEGLRSAIGLVPHRFKAYSKQ